MTRKELDTSTFTDAELLGWVISCPYDFVPLTSQDYKSAELMSKRLGSIFSKAALKGAVKRKGLRG